jgi:hypothetical protein
MTAYQLFQSVAETLQSELVCFVEAWQPPYDGENPLYESSGILYEIGASKVVEGRFLTALETPITLRIFGDKPFVETKFSQLSSSLRNNPAFSMLDYENYTTFDGGMIHWMRIRYDWQIKVDKGVYQTVLTKIKITLSA